MRSGHLHISRSLVVATLFLLVPAVWGQTAPELSTQLQLVRPIDSIGRDASGQNQEQVVGEVTQFPLRMRAETMDGRPVANAQIHFEVVLYPESAKEWELATNAQTDGAGMAQVYFKVGDTPGEYLISARIADATLGTGQLFFRINGLESYWMTKMFMAMIGGLGMFMYGMSIMSGGLKKSAGNRLRFVLQSLTKSRFRGLMAGAFVTTIIQSSSATTVMLVSFVEAGLIKFTQTLGVILGADIGTTITAQIIAFHVSDFAYLLIGFGFTLRLVARKEALQSLGEAILGFGLVFNGMNLMSNALMPLRSFPPFLQSLAGFETPLTGILVGALITVIIQSSTAFTGLVIVLGSQGLITLEAAIPLILGTNIGTTVTATLASLGSGREAKRVAVAHAVFKIGGVLLFVFWIPTFAEIVKFITPGADDSAAYLAVPRQIANAHSIFNITLAAIFFPFIDRMAQLIIRIMPDMPLPLGIKPTVSHLDTGLIETPDLALNLAKAEVEDLVILTKIMLKESIRPFTENGEVLDSSYPEMTVIEGLRMREKKVNFLDEQVSGYLFEVSRGGITNRQANEAYVLMSISHEMEAIGDIIDKIIVPLVKRKSVAKVAFLDEGKMEIETYHLAAMKQISRCSEAISDFEPDKARRMLAKSAKYKAQTEELKRTHFERLRNRGGNIAQAEDIHNDLVDAIKKISDTLTNVAHTILEGLGDQRKETRD